MSYPGIRKLTSVGIKYIIHTCNQCEECMAGDDAICSSHKCSVFDLPGTFQQL